MTPAQLVNVIGGVLLTTFFLWVYVASQERLKDPNNTSFIYLDQLTDVALLEGTGNWAIRVDRQSGNLHKYLEGQGTAADAIAEVLKSFRRARIDTVIVKTNTADRLEVVRMFHNHRGSNEGRKVGGAAVWRIA